MRLFEFRPGAQDLPASLTVAVGDVLRFAASGGRVHEGTAVESMGAFVRGAVGTDGTTLSPAGSPNAVLFRAVNPGTATIEIAFGDPFGERRSARMDITVQ